MSDCHKIYCTFLDLSLNFLIKTKIIPSDFFSKIGLDPLQPIMYILPCNAQIEFLTLRKQCLKQGLVDPLEPICIDGIIFPRYIFIHDKSHLLSFLSKKSQSIELFNRCLEIHRTHPKLNVQIILVSIMFGRSPGVDVNLNRSEQKYHLLNGIKKLISILWFGRDSFIRFSNPLSMRYIIIKYGADKSLAKKLERLARIHFIRQRLVAIGPRLQIRQDFLNKLLTSKSVKKAIEDEMRNKKISKKQAKKHAIFIINEISANFSYEAIRLSDRIFSWIWKRLYQRLHIKNIERVRKIAEKGHGIVYIPCHRSHMDYLLLSYVLYGQGLVPPYIAAGVNLNFWPIGSIFRRLGAFFIRRTFKSNKFYFIIFREYFSDLITRGCSIEYFIEGGRSRTGRLLEPKTGTLTMTIQTMLRGGRPITLVPIYLGYEHVMEVSTYIKELKGSVKEKENFFKMLRGLRKLCNFGQGYINFGEPISLMTWLNNRVPQWRNTIHSLEDPRPTWLTTTVNDIADTIMVRINNAAATNSINLCSSMLLGAREYSLTRSQLLTQLSCYLDLLRNVPYSPDITVPNMTPEALLQHAIAMNKFTIKKNSINEIIFLSRDQAISMTYYRNNIQHLLIFPALIANIINAYSYISREHILQCVMLIYPMMKAELFMRFSKNQVSEVVNSFIIEFKRQGLISVQESFIGLVSERSQILEILANSVRDNLQRYAITFSLLRFNYHVSLSDLEKKSCIIAQHLSRIREINSPEFFDKSVFSILIETLCNEGYINGNRDNISLKIFTTWNILKKIITPNVLTIIENMHVLIDTS